jgi:hypothetical protein
MGEKREKFIQINFSGYIYCFGSYHFKKIIRIKKRKYISLLTFDQ